MTKKFCDRCKKEDTSAEKRFGTYDPYASYSAVSYCEFYLPTSHKDLQKTQYELCFYCIRELASRNKIFMDEGKDMRVRG